MNITGITWKGESIDDVEILREIPSELLHLLSEINGFILHEGALHVRGATLNPEWHSLRAAWHGPNAFCTLYPNVQPSDIPFGQDQVGDQFLIRQGTVVRLFAETGEIEPLAKNLDEFFIKVKEDIEGFLNVGLGHKMQPGQLLHAYPPFCFQGSENASLEPIRASEVIGLHADLARQIRDVPDGGEVEFRVVD